MHNEDIDVFQLYLNAEIKASPMLMFSCKHQQQPAFCRYSSSAVGMLPGILLHVIHHDALTGVLEEAKFYGIESVIPELERISQVNIALLFVIQNILHMCSCRKD